MIDLAQADRTLRTRQQPVQYGWDNIGPPESARKGDICVIRCSNGSPEILKIIPQHAYREWVGCFTYVGEH